MTTFYAKCQTSDAEFTFETVEEYERQTDRLGTREFNISVEDGEEIDIALLDSIGVDSTDLVEVEIMIEALDSWNEYEKQQALAMCEVYGVSVEWIDCPSTWDCDLYVGYDMEDLAREFVEEGVMFGELPDRVIPYLDMGKIARDLSMDYVEVDLNGLTCVVRR